VIDLTQHGLSREWIVGIRQEFSEAGLSSEDVTRAGAFILDLMVRDGLAPEGTTFARVHAFVHGYGPNPFADVDGPPERSLLAAAAAMLLPRTKTDVFAFLALLVAIVQLAVSLRPTEPAPTFTPDQIEQIIDRVLQGQQTTPTPDAPDCVPSKQAHHPVGVVDVG
jgi:hypothetical protein